MLRERPATASAVLASSLLHTEGIFWAVLLGLLALPGRLRDRGAAPVRRYVLRPPARGLPAYSFVRFQYYQVLLPNPVYLKVSFGPEVLLRGHRYVAMFFLTFLTR